MPGIQNFRSALGGFNREDVVRYIEYINHQHNAQIEQLNTQLQNAREALVKAEAAPKSDSDLLAQLEAAQAKCAALEAQLAERPQAAPAQTGDELEAYRRAEKAERLARERAAQIYAQANAVLADATLKVEAASEGMNSVAAQLAERLQKSQQELQDAVSAMYAIRPEEE